MQGAGFSRNRAGNKEFFDMLQAAAFTGELPAFF